VVISPANDTHHSTSKNIRTNFKVFSYSKINKVCYPLGTRREPQRTFCELHTELCNVSGSATDCSLRAINKSHHIIQYLLPFTRRRASRHSSARIVTRLRDAHQRYRGSLPAGKKILTYSPKLRPELGPTQILFRWAPGVAFLRVTGCEPEH